jgi:hypothetical protein
VTASSASALAIASSWCGIMCCRKLRVSVVASGIDIIPGPVPMPPPGAAHAAAHGARAGAHAALGAAEAERGEQEDDR